MSMNIYVGNLNYRVREEDLTGLLQQYGAVTSARVITDRETGAHADSASSKWKTRTMHAVPSKSCSIRNSKVAS